MALLNPLQAPRFSPRRDDDVGHRSGGVSSARVLIVEDDDASRHALHYELRSMFHILVAASGREALTALSEHNDVGVVLADHRMPEMTGINLLLEVRKKYPHIVRILYTAYPEDDLEKRVVQSGIAHDYLQKPVEPLVLGITLQAAMDKYLHRWTCDGCAHECEECPFEVDEEVEVELLKLRKSREELRVLS